MIDAVRYLEAKRSVDDRALNPGVWRALVAAVGDAVAGPWRVIEVGAGIGTMLQRSVDWELFAAVADEHRPLSVSYTLVDIDKGLVERARERLAPWAAELGLPSVELAFDARVGDALDPSLGDEGGWDLVVACAVVDLLPLNEVVSRLSALLRPGGLLYLPITFDGVTALEPIIDPELDDAIVALFHRTMDERRCAGRPTGGSRAGRSLHAALVGAGLDVLALGSSDWVVFPRDGRYPGDEAFFLHAILATIGEALHGRPELDQHRLASWLEQRHRQVDAAELVYVAHQLDALAQLRS